MNKYMFTTMNSIKFHSHSVTLSLSFSLLFCDFCMFFHVIYFSFFNNSAHFYKDIFHLVLDNFSILVFVIQFKEPLQFFIRFKKC